MNYELGRCNESKLSLTIKLEGRHCILRYLDLKPVFVVATLADLVFGIGNIHFAGESNRANIRLRDCSLYPVSVLIAQSQLCSQTRCCSLLSAGSLALPFDPAARGTDATSRLRFAGANVFRALGGTSCTVHR